MNNSSQKFVLDSFALMAFLAKEPGFKFIEQLLEQAKKKDLSLWMSKINLGEVYYNLYREQGEEETEKIMSWLKMCPVNFIDVDDELLFSAAKLKGKYLISYADAFALATSLRYEAPIITGDPQFEKVKDLVNIKWLAGRK